MADQYVISAANLDYIENNLQIIHQSLDYVNSEVTDVDNNVKIIYNNLGKLAQEFHDFVHTQIMANNKADSQARLIQIRQELEKKYGHYDNVRRTTTGILQADDIGIVRKDTISTATEELMISTPGYWLAPCLVALAAWINDKKELADKALKEGIKRNNEKTSLFFALICRRAERKSAALKWTQRYLAAQDEENLDRNCVIVLDAYASGLLGSDSEGVISDQIGEWLEKLSNKPGFVEQQISQWSDAINLQRKPLDVGEYTYLRKYSKTWPILQDIMEGAMLHEEILNYFTNIFDQEASTNTLKEQLDEILNDLVTDFDTEELPLRKEEKYHQYVVEYEGDIDRAQKSMSIEQTAFEQHKDFTQLLTDAAMKPESSNSSVSTQKLAIALSKDWISDAYNDVVAQNRAKIPNEIEINVDTFNDKTTDGRNEDELVNRFNALVNKEKSDSLAQNVLTGFDKFCLFGGIAIGVIGLLMMLFGQIFLGIIAVIACIGMVIRYFSRKKKVNNIRQNINAQFEEKRVNGVQIIRATLAEVVDFREEFSQKDGESQKIVDFLDEMNPSQYVKQLAGSNRKILVK